LGFTSIDRFAEKYYNLSPYQYAANNPLRYIDINGDSISTTQAFMNDQQSSNALAYILSTRLGKAYFAKYAAKGDVIKIGNKTFSFDKNGEYSSKGIDLKLDIHKGETADGLTSSNEANDGGTFDINVSIDTKSRSPFESTETLLHEVFLEADYIANDLKDGKKDYNNISKWVQNDWLKGDVSNYGHSQNYLDRKKYGGENLLWPGNAYRVLQDVNKSLNLRLTNQQIQNQMNYYGFYGKIFGKF
jgi:hypothetical protein